MHTTLWYNISKGESLAVSVDLSQIVGLACTDFHGLCKEWFPSDLAIQSEIPC